ncbi:MAG: hypothetical protein WD887_02285 [Candidatus Saccharimonadales bacterium]
MPPEDNSIKPTQPTGPEPPSYEQPITVGHQAVMSTPPTENSDGSTAIPVTVNHSFSPAPPPTPLNEPPTPEIPLAPPEPVPVPPPDSHPLQAKIDAHPLFQNDGYNPQPPQAEQGLSPMAAPPPERPKGRKLLWTLLALLVLLGSYTAVDALTDIKLPIELL